MSTPKIFINGTEGSVLLLTAYCDKTRTKWAPPWQKWLIFNSHLMIIAYYNLLMQGIGRGFICFITVWTKYDACCMQFMVGLRIQKIHRIGNFWVSAMTTKIMLDYVNSNICIQKSASNMWALPLVALASPVKLYNGHCSSHGHFICRRIQADCYLCVFECEKAIASSR